MGIIGYRNGALGETRAAEFLKKQKYKIIAKNYRCRQGEIDIIARDKKTIVFVEVKARESSEFGQPSEYVTKGKTDKIKKAALFYLHENGLDDADARFDVVEILGDEINLIKNAF